MFGDLLNETKGFKYQIIVKGLLEKYKHNGEIEIARVYFNSEAKTVINHIFRLENSFEKYLYVIDVWINKESGWIVESIKSQYINISTYRPLSGSYIGLPEKLQNPRKVLINIKGIQKGLKKVDKKLFKHITNPGKITEEDKEFISNLDYDEIEFPHPRKRFYQD